MLRIVIDINHPAHVHFFKNFYWQMKRNNHDLLVTASRKEMAFDLLGSYDINFVDLGSYGNTLFSKARNLLNLDYKMYKVCSEFKPDIMVGLGSVRAPHVASILKKPYIAFKDSETMEQYILWGHFANVVCTPACFRKNLGKRQLRYDGYHELAYLHPNFFKPDRSILDELGVEKKDKYAIVRFVAWRASHDVGKQGIKKQRQLVEELAKHCTVFVTAELGDSLELKQYYMKIKPERIHHAMYYASLFLGDSQTMATESALLGTPAIRCNSFVGPNDMGNFIDLEKKYDVLHNTNNESIALKMAKRLIADDNSKLKWQSKTKKIFQEKIDVTSFMMWLVEGYPKSVEIAKNDISWQLMFMQRHNVFPVGYTSNSI
ncbi:MAG: DUF354 domain-containing protein [Firmicutes bacterium]|nr:DUF354 domain-containing protein [Bacillota bacterium]